MSGLSFFQSILGNKVLKGTQEVDLKEVVEPADYVAVYISSSDRHPAGRGAWIHSSSFDPLFIKAYQEISKKGGKKLATIFVTCDTLDYEFKSYFGKMPWHAVPYTNKEYTGYCGKAAKYLNCHRIPKLAFFNKEGKLLEADGLRLVYEKGADCLKMLDPVTKTAHMKELMEKLFAVMDLNSDGYVDADEIKECLIILGCPPEQTSEEVKKWMTRDQDGDGKLSKAEFTVAEYRLNDQATTEALTDDLAAKKKEYFEHKKVRGEVDKLKGSTAFFNNLLGDKLLDQGKEVDTKSVVEGKDYVAIYLGRKWCRRFFPKLLEAYKSIQEAGKEKLATIFVSYDESENDFKSHYPKMPWPAVPFSPEVHKILCNFENSMCAFRQAHMSRVAKYLRCYDSRCYPMVVVFDSKGNLKSEDGEELVNRYGAQFLGKL